MARFCASGGKIVSACKTKDALRDPWIKKNRKKIVEIDCAGQVVLPGFVDSHTHPAFRHPAAGGFREAHRRRDLRTDRGSRRRNSFERRGRAQGRQEAAGGESAGRAARDGGAGHDHGRSQVRIRADASTPKSNRSKPSAAQPPNGREPWSQPCWARMSSPRNFTAGRRNMSMWSVKR